MKNNTWILLLLWLVMTYSGATKVGSFEIHVQRILKSVTPSDEENKDLNLSSLNLNGIESEAFNNVTYITSLDLSNNPFEHLPSNVFSNLTNLENLQLTNINFKHFNYKNLFFNSSKLKILNLTNSELRLYFNFNSTIFSNLPDDTDIILPLNQIQYVKPQMFSMNQEMQIGLTNDFECEKTRYPKSLLIPRRKKYYSLSDINIDKISKLPKKCINVHVRDGIVANVSIRNDINEEKLNDNCESFIIFEDTIYLKQNNIKGFEKTWYNVNVSKNQSFLYLDHNGITEVDENLLNDLPENVISVSVGVNKIKTLRSNVMINNNIIMLDFSSNEIEVIDDEAFKNINSLLELELQFNRISNLNFVRYLPKVLESLNLRHNSITTIPDDAFSHLVELWELYLAENKIKLINPRSFYNLNKLVYLDITGNDLVKIETGSFDGFDYLHSLKMSNNNKLTSIENRLFGKMHCLKELDIGITSFKRGIFYGLPFNSEIKIITYGNHWANKINNVTLLMQPGMFKNYDNL